MAQKQYGIIPHDTSQVGYGQDTPVVHRRESKEGFVDRMVKKIMKFRKKKAKKKKPTYGEAGRETKSNIQRRREAPEQARDNK
jgi:hypothetical protein